MYTLTRNQLDKAVMVKRGSRNYIEVTIDGKIMQLGHSKIHMDSKKLITESYKHLLIHNESTYKHWGCRCSTCKAAKKAELKARIMEELKMDTYECAICQSRTNLEADHLQACNKLLHIDSFKGHLHKPELQGFITEEISKCQIICKTCHTESYGPDRKTGRVRNVYKTPWLIKTIDGKPVSPWTSAQVIKLLQQLNFKPGDKPRVLTKEEWATYRTYAASINKPSIEFQSTEPNLV